MNRRSLIGWLLAMPLAQVLARSAVAQRSLSAEEVEALRAGWREFLAAGADVAESKAPLERTEAEWRALLGRSEFDVLREAGTERAFSSALNVEKRPGVYVCAACDLPLFTSQMKYDSGTGWPSFFTTIPDVFETRRDFVLLFPRTEYHCVRCGGHHGHVFDDGPPPTRQRWCNNGVALRFIPMTGTA